MAEERMYIRLNIPSWDRNELRNAFMVLSGVKGRRHFRLLLRARIKDEIGDWNPVLLSSARLGIAEGIRALGLKGGRIAVPGYVCPSVITALRWIDAQIVPVDCSPQSIRFDPSALESVVREGKADSILAPNTYGLDQDLPFLRSFGLPVIEDAAYQAGCVDPENGKMAGLRADAGIWSFNFKALAGISGGTLLLPEGVKSPDSRRTPPPGKQFRDMWRFLNYLLRSFGKHRIPRIFLGGEPPKREPEGFVRPCLLAMDDMEMSELQAAIILAQWNARQRIGKRQQANSEVIHSAIRESAAFSMLYHLGEATMVHLFPLLIADIATDLPGDRDAVRGMFYRHGLQTEGPYPVIQSSSALPNSHDLASRLLLVPCHATLGDSQMERILNAIQEANCAIQK